MDAKIKREPGRFFVTINGHDSQLSYSLIDGVMDITDVFVHEKHRGEGIASELCIAAFGFARERGFKVMPTCPYVSEKFLPEHQNDKDLVFEGKLFYKARKK